MTSVVANKVEPDLLTGYMHALYPSSLTAFGTPRLLPKSGGWLLERPVPDSGLTDAMGCYPLFCCRDFSHLRSDLDSLQGKFVTVSLVVDPFAGCGEADLRRIFGVVRLFKEHLVADLTQPVNDLAPKYHRKYARRALRDVQIVPAEAPAAHLDEWCELYGNLIRRHNISGLRAFSRAAFQQQLGTPGIVMLRAIHKGVAVGAHLWYQQGEVGYSHLSAYADMGYELRVSYALNWAANEYFAGKVRWLDLGAGAGLSASAADGLTTFKKGWSTGSRPAYFCGEICDAPAYVFLTKRAGPDATGYFPLYRRGEFS
jgi:hypothetical protein